MPNVRRDGLPRPKVRRDGVYRPNVRRGGGYRPKVRREGYLKPRVRRSSPVRELVPAAGAASAAGRTGMIATGAGMSLLVFALVNMVFSCLAGPGRKVVPPPVTGCPAPPPCRQGPDCPFHRVVSMGTNTYRSAWACRRCVQVGPALPE